MVVATTMEALWFRFGIASYRIFENQIGNLRKKKKKNRENEFLNSKFWELTSQPRQFTEKRRIFPGNKLFFWVLYTNRKNKSI
uniref:Uncharacterized protein n=1 Tax=Noccaea caerulescens TaxID=107243 RepID=A0A1J3CV18_NOCCA